MSRIEELLKNAKPEWKKLGEVCVVSKGEQFNKRDMLETGTYPVINGGITPSGFVEVFNSQENTITVSQGGASSGFVNFIKTKFWLGAHAFSVLPSSAVIQYYNYDNTCFNRFLFHVLKQKQDKLQKSKCGAGIPSLSKETLLNVEIPIVSRELQAEIVRILDIFMELTNGLIPSLKKELELRERQYRYYLEKLLSCEYLRTCNKKIDEREVVVYKLKEVCNISAGGDVPKHSFSKERNNEYNVPIISNGTAENAIYGYTAKAQITIPAVTVSARGTIGYVEYRDYPYYPIVRLLSLIPKQDSQLSTKYLYYCLSQKEFLTSTAGIKQLTIPMLKEETIPLPPLSVQSHIVSILEKFEILVHDISEGLPAEIALRQKQYEYYREKLLTFKGYN